MKVAITKKDLISIQMNTIKDKDKEELLKYIESILSELNELKSKRNEN